MIIPAIALSIEKKIYYIIFKCNVFVFFINSFLGNQFVWHLRRKLKLWFVLFRFPWQVSAWGEFPVFIWIVTGITNLKDPNENRFLEMWISTWTVQQFFFFNFCLFSQNPTIQSLNVKYLNVKPVMFVDCKNIVFAFFLSRANRIKTIIYGISPMLFFKYFWKSERKQRRAKKEEKRKERTNERTNERKI